ncbi:helix-turn-helix domain-containing protein [Natrinema gelatinilyticum]|uniref:helix-turn-helix domain-containing protein n=1 Tax=Natrinema gelatinilyticum TaxID=2961571 RepID=UPI003CE59973
MRYNYRYRLNPTDELHERLAWTVDTCRQVYNHFLHRLNRKDSTTAYSEQSVLPDLKREWTDLKQVHSKVLQKVVQRLYDNLSTLKGRKDNGYRVGELKWKGPQEYRSIKYSQTGFELKNTSGRTVLSLSKIGDIPMVYSLTARVPRGLTPRVNRVSFISFTNVFKDTVVRIKDCTSSQLCTVAEECGSLKTHVFGVVRRTPSGRGGAADPHGHTACSGVNSR